MSFLTDPWYALGDLALWIFLAGALVSVSCSQIGTVLVLQRMSLVGDAISHSVLPGIVVAFLFVGSLSSPWLLVGATATGLLATFLIQGIHRHSRIKEDSATGLAFTSLFALGVVLIGMNASKVDLDIDCVLHGELDRVPQGAVVDVFGTLMPKSVLTLAVVTIFAVLGIWTRLRVVLISAFDSAQAASVGINAGRVHLVNMTLLSLVVVASFEAVGAVLVIALLILPGATAWLCSDRFERVLILAALHGVLASALGLAIAYRFNCNSAAAMVIAGAVLFALALFFGPSGGIVTRWWLRSRSV